MSNVRDFGVSGDGRTDESAALEHALHDGDGTLEFPPGTYRLSRTLHVDLARHGRFALSGQGGTAKLLMTGPGPAISLLAQHGGSADPKTFTPAEWDRERMPTISQIEIVGGHPEADGIRIEGVMQPTLAGVLIREVRTGVHITKRARNVVISHCHIYNNKGIGVHLDKVNLHQAIITGSHISYCRLGGIRIEGSEIRNLQITGNDIEYNNNAAHKVPGADGEPTAEIYIDSREGTVREGTISSNTIQATYSPGGSNVRFIGHPGPPLKASEQAPASGDYAHKTGMFTISGNLIGSQETNIHLTSARGITITGNVIYSAFRRNLLVEGCRNIVVGSNAFEHNPDYKELELCTGIRFADSVDCMLTGVLIQDARAGQPTVKQAIPIEREGVVELIRCRRMNLSGCQVVEPTPVGIYLEDCANTLITGCTVLDARQPPLMRAAIRWKGTGTGSQIGVCRLGRGTAGTLMLEPNVPVVNVLEG